MQRQVQALAWPVTSHLITCCYGTLQRCLCSSSSSFISQQQPYSTSTSSSSSSGSGNDSSSSSGSSNSRTESSSSSLPWHLQDQIKLEGMLFHGYHGALPEENVLGQKFLVDATLWADMAAAGRSDRLDDTIDYTKAYSIVQGVVQGKARVLQEAVVEDVCQQLLQSDTRVSAVQVYIRKPHVCMTGVLDSVGIQIFRQRKPDAAPAQGSSS